MNRPHIRFAVSVAFAGFALTSVPAGAQSPAVSPPPADQPMPPPVAPPAPPVGSVAPAQPMPPPPALPVASPSAAPPPAAEPDLLIRQREAFARGNDLYDHNKYPEAEVDYLEAWKLKKTYDVAGNLGLLEADMNKPRAAAEYLAYALREFPAGGAPAKRDKLLKRFNEMKQRVGTLRVAVSKPGVEVFVDNVSIGFGPLETEVFVEPGVHVAEGRLENTTPRTSSIRVERGQAVDVGLSYSDASRRRVILYSGYGVTAAGAIVGATLLGLSASKSSTVNNLRAGVPSSGCGNPNTPGAAPSPCQSLQGALSDRATFGNAGFWTLLGAGVVGVGTTIYAFTSKPEAPRVGLQLVPVMSPEGGGALLRGMF